MTKITWQDAGYCVEEGVKILFYAVISLLFIPFIPVFLLAWGVGYIKIRWFNG